MATLVGLHIPKCAGTTLLRRVESVLPGGQIYQNTSIIENWRKGRVEFLDIPRPSQLRFVFGHNVHEEMLKLLAEPILFTGLREPTDRLRSALKYEIKLRSQQERNAPDITDLVRETQNPTCWFLINRFPHIARRDTSGSLFEKARRVLKVCSFVFFMDTFETAATAICATLGIHPEKRNVNISDSELFKDIDMSAATLGDDQELYQWATETFHDLDISSAIQYSTSELRDFLETPLRLDALRTFLFNAQAREYQQWGVLDKVIATRTLRQSHFRSELDAYAAEKLRELT